MSDSTTRCRLTKTYAEKIPLIEGEGDKRITHWDDRTIGFGVRVSSSTKTYIVYTRIKGRINEKTGRPMEIRETIGRVGQIRFDDAEAKARKILEDAAKGIAPADLRKEAERQREVDKTRNISLKTIFKEYLETNKRLKDSTKGFYTTCLDTCFEDWKEKPVRAITVEDVRNRHEALSIKVVPPKREPVKRKSRRKADLTSGINDLRVIPERAKTNGPGTANSAMKTLRILLNYAIENYPDVISTNPVSLALKKRWNVLKARQDHITPDQLPAWYNAVKKSPNDTMRDALLLLLFTGLRSASECFALPWSDVDWTAKQIVFRDTKNHTTLTLPMTKQIFEVLDGRKHYAQKCEYVFPSPKAKSGHIEDIRKELAKANKESGLDITPHDLRRTFTTYAYQRSIAMLTIKALVNHISDTPSSDITADYIQVSFRDRKIAIRAINRYMIDIIEGRYKDDFEEDDF